ncbi:MAG TPA: glycosyltransferase, partial [Armatimonadota bacterium]|nr:glycosyltransferase [Armatimonadota bacterium]
MHIGLDARAISYPKTGDRSYTLGLIGGLAAVNQALGSPHRFTLYFDREPPADLPCARGGELLPGWATRVLSARIGRLWTLRALPAAARQDRLDVLHVQYNGPRLRGPALVTTVHDVSFRLHPEWFPLKDRLVLDWGLRATLRRAAGVLAVSECTSRDLQDIYRVPADRITVTPNALLEGFGPPGEERVSEVLQRHALQRPYALFVGVLQPRKNLERIIRAFVSARERHGLRHQFVIAGKVGWKAEA